MEYMDAARTPKLSIVYENNFDGFGLYGRSGSKLTNDRNLLLMYSYQEPKSPRESHPSARRREPQASA